MSGGKKETAHFKRFFLFLPVDAQGPNRLQQDPSDTSKNNRLLALVTLGEGWHNNHHYFMASVGQGSYWREIDLTYYGLKSLSWFCLVRELRRVPDHILAKGQSLAASAA
jgi:stearoyl-CoA desaturase (delta-9 desaturase)